MLTGPECDTCKQLHPIWLMIAAAMPGLVWAADCGTQAEVCGSWAGTRQPVFLIWDGMILEQYPGKLDIDSLVAYMKGVASRVFSRPAASPAERERLEAEQKERRACLHAAAGPEAAITSNVTHTAASIAVSLGVGGGVSGGGVSGGGVSGGATGGGGRGPPLLLELSEAEVRCGAPLPATVKLVAMLLHSAGYVVLRGAMPDATVAALQASLSDAVAASVERAARGEVEEGGVGLHACDANGTVCYGGWHKAHRFKLAPVLAGPFASDAVLRNPYVMPALDRAFVSSPAVLQAVASDCNVHGSTTQPPHRDVSFGMAGRGDEGVSAAGARRPTVLLANIALQDVGGDVDGPIELWPGTQAHELPGLEATLTGTPEDGANVEAEAVCALLPSVRVTMRAGDVLLRDPVMVHRGTPRLRAGARLLATIIYRARDYTGTWDYLNVNQYGRHPLHGFSQLSDAARALIPPPREPAG